MKGRGGLNARPSAGLQLTEPSIAPYLISFLEVISVIEGPGTGHLPVHLQLWRINPEGVGEPEKRELTE